MGPVKSDHNNWLITITVKFSDLINNSSISTGGGRRKGRGWSGDAETDIPALSFPKHVSGLHSCDDLAFNKVYIVISIVRI